MLVPADDLPDYFLRCRRETLSSAAASRLRRLRQHRENIRRCAQELGIDLVGGISSTPSSSSRGLGGADEREPLVVRGVRICGRASAVSASGSVASRVAVGSELAAGSSSGVSVSGRISAICASGSLDSGVAATSELAAGSSAGVGVSGRISAVSASGSLDSGVAAGSELAAGSSAGVRDGGRTSAASASGFPASGVAARSELTFGSSAGVGFHAGTAALSTSGSQTFGFAATREHVVEHAGGSLSGRSPSCRGSVASDAFDQTVETKAAEEVEPLSPTSEDDLFQLMRFYNFSGSSVSPKRPQLDGSSIPPARLTTSPIGSKSDLSEVGGQRPPDFAVGTSWMGTGIEQNSFGSLRGGTASSGEHLGLSGAAASTPKTSPSGVSPLLGVSGVASSRSRESAASTPNMSPGVVSPLQGGSVAAASHSQESAASTPKTGPGVASASQGGSGAASSRSGFSESRRLLAEGSNASNPLVSYSRSQLLSLFDDCVSPLPKQSVPATLDAEQRRLVAAMFGEPAPCLPSEAASEDADTAAFEFGSILQRWRQRYGEFQRVAATVEARNGPDGAPCQGLVQAAPTPAAAALERGRTHGDRVSTSSPSASSSSFPEGFALSGGFDSDEALMRRLLQDLNLDTLNGDALLKRAPASARPTGLLEAASRQSSAGKATSQAAGATPGSVVPAAAAVAVTEATLATAGGGRAVQPARGSALAQAVMSASEAVEASSLTPAAAATAVAAEAASPVAAAPPPGGKADAGHASAESDLAAPSAAVSTGAKPSSPVALLSAPLVEAASNPVPAEEELLAAKMVALEVEVKRLAAKLDKGTPSASARPRDSGHILASSLAFSEYALSSSMASLSGTGGLLAASAANPRAAVVASSRPAMAEPTEEARGQSVRDSGPGLPEASPPAMPPQRLDKLRSGATQEDALAHPGSRTSQGAIPALHRTESAAPEIVERGALGRQGAGPLPPPIRSMQPSEPCAGAPQGSVAFGPAKGNAGSVPWPMRGYEPALRGRAPNDEGSGPTSCTQRSPQELIAPGLGQIALQQPSGAWGPRGMWPPPASAPASQPPPPPAPSEEARLFLAYQVYRQQQLDLLSQSPASFVASVY